VLLVPALVIAALLLPSVAEAKITCEVPQLPAGDVPLLGVPDAPVVGREYRVKAILRPDEGVNATPHLGAEYCGGGPPQEATAGAGGWFRARGSGVYTLRLRFDHPGPWALSFMDRHGMFHALGFRHVRPAPSATGERQFSTKYGPVPWPWLNHRLVMVFFLV
jgi:hypothetical protein